MDISGRKAICYDVNDAGFYYLELTQKEGDCPEGKTPPEQLVCEGDCQGTYLSSVVRGSDITIIGTIYPKPHIMYNSDFLKKHGLSTIEDAQAHINSRIEAEEYRIEDSMGGRRKRVYIGGEHAETLFEGCTFRHVQGQPYRTFLNGIRKKAIEEIACRLSDLKEQASTIDLKDLKKRLAP